MNINPDIASQASSTSVSHINFLQLKMRLESQVRSGANWFYWIAGLSLVNSIINFFEGGLSFVVGLGITQIVDAFGYVLAGEFSGNGALVIKLIAVGLDIAIAALFVLAGFLANKRMRWAFILGMLVYTLDALIFLVFQDWFPLAFHLLALWGMFQGLQALGKMGKLEREVLPSALSPA